MEVVEIIELTQQSEKDPQRHPPNSKRDKRDRTTKNKDKTKWANPNHTHVGMEQGLALPWGEHTKRLCREAGNGTKE